jgi:hypothetical protein
MPQKRPGRAAAAVGDTAVFGMCLVADQLDSCMMVEARIQLAGKPHRFLEVAFCLPYPYGNVLMNVISKLEIPHLWSLFMDCITTPRYLQHK